MPLPGAAGQDKAAQVREPARCRVNVRMDISCGSAGMQTRGKPMEHLVDENLIADLADEAQKELMAFRERDRAKVLKDTVKKLCGRAVPERDPIFWPAGLLMLGLVEAGKTQAVKEYLQLWLQEGGQVRYVDDALAGYVILRLYEADGDPMWKEAAEHIWAFLRSAPTDEAGAIIYNPSRGNAWIYADGCGQTSLFLSRYAKVFGAAEAADLARVQIGSFLNSGLDVRSGLPYHGYDAKSGLRYGIIGWGRAVGWFLMGLAGYLSDREDPEAAAAAREMTDSVFSYLRRDRLFSWQLEALDGPLDTSASGMIYWSADRLCEAGVLKDFDRNLLADGADALRRQINGGKVFGASAECTDFAQYRQEYGSYPWGQGAVLAFLAGLQVK